MEESRAVAVSPRVLVTVAASAVDRHSGAEKRTGLAAPHDTWLVDARIRRPEPGRRKKAGHVGVKEGGVGPWHGTDERRWRWWLPARVMGGDQVFS